MSDPNMDTADAHANWQAGLWEELNGALDAAERDARARGIGFVKVIWPGPRYEHVALSDVLRTLDDTEET